MEDLGEVIVGEGEKDGMQMRQKSLTEASYQLGVGQLTRSTESCLQAENQVAETAEVIEDRLSVALTNRFHLKIQMVSGLTRAKEPEKPGAGLGVVVKRSELRQERCGDCAQLGAVGEHKC